MTAVAASRSPEAPPAPLISIVTAAYNSAATIGGALASVGAQRCRDLEHIVVDGASRDATCEIVRASAHPVRLISEPDAGIYDAFNKGLRLARGELIAFLNSDDAYAHGDVTAIVAEAARAHPEIDILHGDMDLVDASGAVVKEVRFPGAVPVGSREYRKHYGRFAWCMAIPHPSTFVRRRVFERIGEFDAGYRIAADYDLLLRAWRAGATFRHLPSVLVRMRNDGISNVREWRADLEMLRSSRAHSPSRIAPLIQFARHQAVKWLERRAPRVLAAVRRVLRGREPRPASVLPRSR